MLRIKPRINDDLNESYEFSTGDEFQYETRVVRDSLNDDLILMPWHMPEAEEVSFCSCKGFGYKQTFCKHIKEVLNYFKDTSLNYRLDSPPTINSKGD